MTKNYISKSYFGYLTQIEIKKNFQSLKTNLFLCVVVMEGFLSLSVMRSLRRKGEWRSLSDNTACKHPNSNLKPIKPCLVIKFSVFFKNVFSLDEFSKQLFIYDSVYQIFKKYVTQECFFISYVWTLGYFKQKTTKCLFNSVVTLKTYWYDNYVVLQNCRNKEETR